jgi:hypothetical protein
MLLTSWVDDAPWPETKPHFIFVFGLIWFEKILVISLLASLSCLLLVALLVIGALWYRKTRQENGYSYSTIQAEWAAKFIISFLFLFFFFHSLPWWQ